MANNTAVPLPLVSIIIPVYNAALYIEETILCCLQQTYTNIEVIAIDDGSPDNSGDIIKRFEDKRIQYHRIQNSGAAEARNAGLKLASGDLVQFLDADDILDKEKLYHQVQLYLQYGDDYVYSGAMGSIYNGEYYRESDYDLYERDFTREEYFSVVLNQFGKFLTTGVWLTPSKLVKSTHGWDKQAGLNDDGEYFMRMIMASKGIKYSDKSVFYYRRDVANSFSKVFDKKEVFEKWLYSYTSYARSFTEKIKSSEGKELAWKALSVYYCHSYPNHPDLLKKCREQMKQLGYNSPYPNGGNKLVMLSKYIGVDGALKILNTMSRAKKLLK